jgi:PPOX class probable FMN-dependent enzyme
LLPAIDEQGRAFIARSPFLMMATRGADGRVEVSPKGDAPGFVQLESDTSMLIPERVGNNLAFGLTHILETGAIGLNFMLPATNETFRVTGRATLHDDASLRARFGTSERPALLVIRVAVEQCYFHCARAILRSALWQPEQWGARMKVSFGDIIAPRVGGDPAMAKAMDDRLEGVMQNHLWKNP